MLIKRQSETEWEKVQRRKELKEALKLLTEASKSINEDNSEKIRYLLEDCSQGFVDIGDLKGMEKCLRFKASLEPSCADAFLNMGYFYDRAGMTSKALNIYKEGLMINYNDEYLYYNLASLLNKLDSNEDALKFVRRAIEENPERIINYVLAGDIFYNMEDYESAYDYYEKSLYDANDEIWDEKFLEIHIKLADVCFLLERDAFGKYVIEKAIYLFLDKKAEILDIFEIDEEKLDEYTELTDLFDRIYYEGEYSNGQLNGWGVLYNPDWEGNGIKYVGQFKDGLFHGFGSLYDKDGKLRYRGLFQNDIKNGHGEMYDGNEELIYEGEFVYGLPVDIYNAYIIKDNSISKASKPADGYVELYYKDGSKMYFGNIYKNRFSGNGIKYYTNGNIMYSGTYSNGLYNGKGKLYYDTGILKYEGEFNNGIMGGTGKGYWPDGTIWYEGEFKNNLPDGYGKMYHKKGSLRYEGYFKECEYFNTGKEFYENGNLRFEGSFKHVKNFMYGQKNYDKGKFYNSNGELVFEGYYDDFKR